MRDYQMFLKAKHMKNHKLAKLISMILSAILLWQGLVWAKPGQLHSLRAIAFSERSFKEDHYRDALLSTQEAAGDSPYACYSFSVYQVDRLRAEGRQAWVCEKTEFFSADQSVSNMDLVHYFVETDDGWILDGYGTRILVGSDRTTGEWIIVADYLRPGEDFLVAHRDSPIGKRFHFNANVGNVRRLTEEELQRARGWTYAMLGVERPRGISLPGPNMQTGDTAQVIKESMIPILRESVTDRRMAVDIRRMLRRVLRLAEADWSTPEDVFNRYVRFMRWVILEVADLDTIRQFEVVGIRLKTLNDWHLQELGRPRVRLPRMAPAKIARLRPTPRELKLLMRDVIKSTLAIEGVDRSIRVELREMLKLTGYPNITPDHVWTLYESLIEGFPAEMTQEVEAVATSALRGLYENYLARRRRRQSYPWDITNSPEVRFVLEQI